MLSENPETEQLYDPQRREDLSRYLGPHFAVDTVNDPRICRRSDASNYWFNGGPERFALLVGVNDYAQPSDKNYRVTPLKGPANDVALMKELLVTYGFKNDPKHILSLLGKQASHEAIANAFKTQLIDNASKYSGAIFVFYFSGHGSRAYNVSAGDDSVHDTLVAYDSRSDHGKDILDNELIDWFEALRAHTNKITFILDSCHSGSAIKDIGTLVSENCRLTLSRRTADLGIFRQGTARLAPVDTTFRVGSNSLYYLGRLTTNRPTRIRYPLRTAYVTTGFSPTILFRHSSRTAT